MEMAQSDRTNSSQGKRGFDWLDTSSGWAQDEYGALPAAASEPYDWTLKDGAIRTTQVIPITPPAKGGTEKLGWLKRKADVSESSNTTPLDKTATGKLFRKGLTRLIRPATTSPLAPRPLVEKEKPGAIRKSPGLALPLLLLAVIALFIFAYIAQK
jgi:hypothetical protein